MLGDEFKSASLSTVSLFANKGTLKEPTLGAYDPSTGKQANTYVLHPLDYVTVTDKSNKDTSLKATSFRESVVYFSTSFTQQVTETWVIEGLLGEIYDIKDVEIIKVNDVIVGYFTLLKVRL